MKKVILIILILISNKIMGQDDFVSGKQINQPNNYNFQEIDFFDSGEKIKLFGTLITPKHEYSKIIIIAPGSGKGKRNCHYILTEELLKNGIAVFRYDDRGVGESEGKYNISIDDNNRDLYYTVVKLREIDLLKNKYIGIIGHSLGGYATLNSCANELPIDFIILMSTPLEKFGGFKKPKFKLINNTNIKFSVKDVLQDIKIPVLFIAGSKDSYSNVKSDCKFLNSQP